MKIGANLKYFRKINNEKIQDIAKIIDVTPQAYSRYEKDQREPKFEHLAKLAEYYDIAPCAFFTDPNFSYALNFLSIGEVAIRIEIAYKEIERIYTNNKYMFRYSMRDIKPHVKLQFDAAVNKLKYAKLELQAKLDHVDDILDKIIHM